MKNFKFLLLVLGLVFLTSCSTSYPVTSSSNINVNFGTYDYNQINYVYSNNYHYFYNTRYINRYGVSCYLYQHPYFIRYQNDYYRKHKTRIPHYNSKYTNSRARVIQSPRNTSNIITRRNSSTQRRTYTVPQRTVTKNKPSVVRRTTSTVRRTPPQSSTTRRR